MKRILPFLVLIVLTITACNNDKDTTTDPANNAGVKPPAVMSYNVLKTYPHDTTSFTEGLELHGNIMYESGGDPGYVGKSLLMATDMTTGKVLQKIKLDKAYFAEGITILNGKIYQATWQEHKIFVYDMNFKKIREFEWPYEGWGMTTDGKSIILDTGGSNIYFINPETFKIEKTLGVYDNNGYVSKINELEYVDGYLYANVWLTNDIIKINIQTGMVESKANLSDIHQKTNLAAPGSEDAVLNGIAYDSTKKSFYITGKNWHTMFEVRFN